MTPRTWFTTAADGFLQVVGNISPEQLDQPGLGDWDLRSLLGHATRAFQTLENYLAIEPGAARTLDGPSSYFVAARAGLADPAAVTQRGRDAGTALGEDPVSTVHQIARRVLKTVAGAPDDAVVTTPVGAMTLIGYLPTRAFELTVHGIDLATATAGPVPADLLEAAVPALELTARIASPHQRVDLLFAATGRTRLGGGFSVL